MIREYIVTLKNPAEKKQGVSWVELLKLLITVIASIVIPIVLVTVGEGIEGSLKSKELETKYVEISVGILTQSPSPETANLRRWAIDNINRYAEIQLSEQAQEELKSESLPTVSSSSSEKAPNYTVPSSPRNIEYVVITDTENPSLRSVANLMSKPYARASYHYVIGTDGTIQKFVDEENIAWHAGRSEWKGKRNLNEITIGIGLVHLASPDGKNWLNLPNEHEAIGPKYTPEQLDSLVSLLSDILQRHNIPVDHVITKQNIAPERRRTDLFGAPLKHLRERIASQLQSKE
jgi:N-acetyl-anhydromuramyl-L-alanine amidase AmpD